jgi:GTPase SAR1 family protein
MRDRKNTEMPEEACKSSGEYHNIDENTNNFSEYIIGANNTFIPTPKIKITKKLPPGYYHIQYNSKYEVYTFVKDKIITDELILLPNNIFNEILNDIDFFFKNKHKFDEYKYVYKRGILLYGEPGCGKTCLTQLLIHKTIKNNGVVFGIKNSDDLSMFGRGISEYLKNIEPETLILVIIEDVDGLVVNNESETYLLNLLDGANQMSHCVYIGCTNYPEKLKERVLNRPSRFDKRYHIGLPNKEIRLAYLSYKISEEDKRKLNLNELAEKTEGLSLAHLGEFIKSVFIFGKDIQTSIGELKDMREYLSSTKFSDTNKIGFGKNEK